MHLIHEMTLLCVDIDQKKQALSDSYLFIHLNPRKMLVLGLI